MHTNNIHFRGEIRKYLYLFVENKSISNVLSEDMEYGKCPKFSYTHLSDKMAYADSVDQEGAV